MEYKCRVIEMQSAKWNAISNPWEPSLDWKILSFFGQNQSFLSLLSKNGQLIFRVTVPEGFRKLPPVKTSLGIHMIYIHWINDDFTVWISEEGEVVVDKDTIFTSASHWYIRACEVQIDRLNKSRAGAANVN